MAKPHPQYYWHCSRPADFLCAVEFAIWDLTNEELNAMGQCGKVDDFGNEFFLYPSTWKMRNYFLVQRADDPGIFHYQAKTEAQNA